MIRTLALLVLIAGVSAECPNACSGHGTCGERDTCSCYQNYQGNDCSERTCYFGIAHVDTPKGDLNADGYISGPLTTVITGSEVYPWGTTEQYPNADANEGHFYMECSNKGICDRKTGECECFDGYEGTACARAACPNDCSGHGTCESIKELAEFGTYDTNSHDVPSAVPVGASDFSAAIEESYAYDLWDQDKTMGCKCDPVYYGADCSLRKCKYGVDPLFHDTFDGVIYQTTVVHLGSKANIGYKGTLATSQPTGQRGNIDGFFRIVFYDVFGEKYVTKRIPADRSVVTAETVKLALEALPNGVISAKSSDVTNEVANTNPDAVNVTMASRSGTLTKVGTIGAGSIGAGAGLGTMGTNGQAMPTMAGTDHQAQDTNPEIGDAFGPEFTITFNTNPGILKTIEIDTTEINQVAAELGNNKFTAASETAGNEIYASGATDYWVANTRQGQFESRYYSPVAKVNTLIYGSKKLYYGSDVSGQVPTGTMVKIGGQELRVVSSNAYSLELSEEYLGESIIPVLTKTGAVVKTVTSSTATTFGEFVAGRETDIATLADQSTDNTVVYDTDMHILNALNPGAKLYVDGCPFVTNTLVRSSATLTPQTDNDCKNLCSCDSYSGCQVANVIYRRSEDPTNQYFYKSDDAGAATDALLPQRGTPYVYAVEALGKNPTVTAGVHNYGGVKEEAGGASVTLSNGVDVTQAIAVQVQLATTASDGAVAADQVFVSRSGCDEVAANTPIWLGNIGPLQPTGTQARIATGGGDFGKYKTAYDQTSVGTPTPGNNGFTVENAEQFFNADTLAPGTDDGTVDFTNAYDGFRPLRGAPNNDYKRGVSGTLEMNGMIMPIWKGKALTISANSGYEAGKVLALAGRRYKIKESTNTWKYDPLQTADYATTRITLTENYAGGALLEVCTACVTQYCSPVGGVGAYFVPQLHLNGHYPGIVAGDKLLLGGYVSEDLQMTVGRTDMSTATTNGVFTQTVTVSNGGTYGTKSADAQAGAGACVSANTDNTRKEITGATLALYKVLHQAGYVGSKVTESATATTYQYVSQCSNRGTCDSSTGVCKCFKGYANDNCDTQNMLAA